MISRVVRFGLNFKTNNCSIISGVNSSKVLYSGNNALLVKRSYCTGSGDSGETDIAKLFKITQEITQELGHTDNIKLLEQDEDLTYSIKDEHPVLPVGVLRTSEGIVRTKEDKGFGSLPDYSKAAVLPINDPIRSIHDLFIHYVDPFETTAPTSYVPFFRFTEPRGYTVESFLKTIGRDCESHVELFPTWEDLMTTTSRKLKEQQVPVRNRKWILHWVEQFKQGRDPVFVTKAKSIAKINKKK